MRRISTHDPPLSLAKDIAALQGRIERKRIAGLVRVISAYCCSQQQRERVLTPHCTARSVHNLLSRFLLIRRSLTHTYDVT